MRFLIDQNVDDVVEDFLRDAGYTVYKVRELVAASAPDQLIAFIAETEGLVIITHDKDYRAIRKLIPTGYRRRVKSGAGVVHITVRESQALNRIRDCLWYIEVCHQQASRKRIRMQVRITPTGMTFVDNASL